MDMQIRNFVTGSQNDHVKGMLELDGKIFEMKTERRIEFSRHEIDEIRPSSGTREK
jgi:hypothetical protein